MTQYRIDLNYNIYIAKLLKIIALGNRVEEILDYTQIYEDIIGSRKINTDNRSADEIIKDTFAKHGISLRKESA